MVRPWPCSVAREAIIAPSRLGAFMPSSRLTRDAVSRFYRASLTLQSRIRAWQHGRMKAAQGFCTMTSCPFASLRSAAALDVDLPLGEQHLRFCLSRAVLGAVLGSLGVATPGLDEDRAASPVLVLSRGIQFT
jgi:hypothetical protein